jgi:hypothetical protein
MRSKRRTVQRSPHRPSRLLDRRHGVGAADDDHLVGRHRHDGLRPGPAARVVEDHLRFVDHRHVDGLAVLTISMVLDTTRASAAGTFSSPVSSEQGTPRATSRSRPSSASSAAGPGRRRPAPAPGARRPRGSCRCSAGRRTASRCAAGGVRSRRCRGSPGRPVRCSGPPACRARRRRCSQRSCARLQAAFSSASVLRRGALGLQARQQRVQVVGLVLAAALDQRFQVRGQLGRVRPAGTGPSAASSAAWSPSRWKAQTGASSTGTRKATGMRQPGSDSGRPGGQPRPHGRPGASTPRPSSAGVRSSISGAPPVPVPRRPGGPARVHQRRVDPAAGPRTGTAFCSSTRPSLSRWARNRRLPSAT